MVNCVFIELPVPCTFMTALCVCKSSMFHQEHRRKFNRRSYTNMHTNTDRGSEAAQKGRSTHTYTRHIYAGGHTSNCLIAAQRTHKRVCMSVCAFARSHAHMLPMPRIYPYYTICILHRLCVVYTRNQSKICNHKTTGAEEYWTTHSKTNIPFRYCCITHSNESYIFPRNIYCLPNKWRTPMPEFWLRLQSDILAVRKNAKLIKSRAWRQ